ncbi:MAG: HEAT repeat domain-containing protein [Microbacteriaceae bacterium]
MDNEAAGRLSGALLAADASDRLQAALSAGTYPNPAFVEVLVQRCAIEPDFFVREMLTWALLRHDAALTVDRLIVELGSTTPQARSQALHTLSKIGDPRAFGAIGVRLLHDDDDDVARAAWRTASGLAPVGEETQVAEIIATEFARGDRDTQRSLSRAFVALGEPARPVVDRYLSHADAEVRLHAAATAWNMENPDDSFETAQFEGRQMLKKLRPLG